MERLQKSKFNSNLADTRTHAQINVVIVVTSWKRRHCLWSPRNDDVALAGGVRVWDVDRYGRDVIIIISVQFSDVRNV